MGRDPEGGRRPAGARSRLRHGRRGPS
jgi:hypothetical protein